ncbi:MAG: 30S ribosomal protein S12 methylthiotransferase RimO, partial [Limnochordia bacterium]
MALKVGVVSLGCAKNLVDTEIGLGALERAGFILTNQETDADILIVNTCTFIDAAKEESLATIRELAQYKERGTCRALIVVGCLGQRYREGLLEEIPAIDAVLGTGDIHRLPQVIQQTLAGERLALIGEPK